MLEDLQVRIKKISVTNFFSDHKYLIITLFLQIILLSTLVFIPYRELFVFPYLVSKGLLPYKQVVDQHFPGLIMLPVNLATLGFDTFKEMRALQLILAPLNTALVYLLGKRFFSSEKKLFLLTLTYVFLQIFYEGYVLWIDSFIPSLFLISLIFIFRATESKNKNYYLFSGVVMGLSVIMKQPSAITAVLVFIYLFYITIKKRTDVVSSYLIGLLSVLTYFLIYLLKTGIFDEFFFWTVIFNLTIYREQATYIFGLKDLSKIIIALGAGFMSYLYIYKMDRSFKTTLIGLYLLGSVFFVYGRYDPVHFQPVLPFIAIAVILTLKYKRNLIYPVLLYLTMLGVITIRLFYLQHAGRIESIDEVKEIEVSKAIEKHKENEDKLFVYAGSNYLYKLTNSLPPNNFFTYQLPWYMEILDQKLVDDLEKDPPKLIITRSEFDNVIANKYMIDKYIKDNYKTIDTVNGYCIKTPNKIN